MTARLFAWAIVVHPHASDRPLGLVLTGNPLPKRRWSRASRTRLAWPRELLRQTFTGVTDLLAHRRERAERTR